ncbi:MAG: cytochrome c3 family protein [Planctomycetes bacterium]|nr:cytochrome c3 family protein [Planctomycetota bacterium]
MKTRRRTTLPSSFQCQTLRCRAFKYIFFVFLALISLGPITGIRGQELQNKNTSGMFNIASLAQKSIIQTVPLWGGSISQLNSSPVPEQKTVLLHHFDLPCENCHGTDSVTSTGKMQSENYTQKRIDINRTCTSFGCHDYDTILNHPVNVSVNSTIPEDMPLDGLRITCLTCHNQTKSSNLSVDIDGGQERRLRIPNEVNLCGSCHRKMPGNLKKQSHWQFSSRAHLGQINRQSGLSSNSAQAIGGIDIESRTCISCHQNITVTMPGENESTSSQKRKRWQSMKDHPIGMEYSRVALRKTTRYKYPLVRNDRIRLFDDKMGCGSCHSLYSQEKKHLVQSNFRSALCFQCHDL